MASTRNAVLAVLCSGMVSASCLLVRGAPPPTKSVVPTPAQTILPTTTPNRPAPISSGEAISPSNAESIHQLARIGNGLADELAWSADGSRLGVSASTGVFVYNPIDRSIIREIPSETAVVAMALSPDGSTVAAAVCLGGPYILGGCSDGEVLLWDLSNGSIKARLPYSPWAPNALAFSPDGRILAGAGCGNLDQFHRQCIEGKVVIWDLATGRSLRQLSGHRGEILDVEFSPHGTMLVSGGADGVVQVWNTNGEKSWFFMTRCEAPIEAVAFSPDATAVAAGTCNEALVWSIESGKLAARSPSFAGKVTSVDFNPLAGTLAAGGDWEDPRIILWSFDPAFPVNAGDSFAGGISALAFSPDGQTLARIGRNGDVGLISGIDGHELAGLEGSWGYFPALAFTTDGSRFAVVSMNGAVQEWDSESGDQVASFAVVDGYVYSIAYTPTDRIVLLACMSGELRYVDGQTGLVLLHSESQSTGCYSVVPPALNHTGTYAAISQRPSGIRVWDLQDDTWESHTDRSFGTEAIVFTDDDQYVAALSMYGVVFLWNMNGDEILRTNRDPEGYYDLGNNYCLAISNDSEWFAEAGAEIHVGPLREDSEPRRLAIPAGDYPTARAIAFGQDPGLIALGVDSGGYSTLLLDTTHGAVLATLEGHTGSISTIWFSPDGSILADASRDGTILLWGVK